MRVPRRIRGLLRQRHRHVYDWNIEFDMVDVMLDLDPGMIGRQLVEQRRSLN